ncbi:BspA family leucine-rich repeat surface protein [Aurantibacter crassamenti]|uniref:BspA family leucine-rich repeat surface protein n=1 Tax=Aurantibacter crassamenti TaxID=1837375 RepID=UPI001939BED8|nr:BspA family leucine-rich repeat surface protein [Aurantibacter crassamenti]MBM1107838.1 BspA family leucine-rich repeat surface protein [Aurantibacter crassamenti]
MKNFTFSMLVVFLFSFLNVHAQNEFITTWRTTTTNESITIPSFIGETYDYSVDWGDGSTTVNEKGDAIHTYTSAGTYTVSITGLFPRIYFEFPDDRLKILTVEQWGDNPWSSMNRAFFSCENIEVNATDIPDFSNMNDTSDMFYQCFNMQGNPSFENWDVSTITNMSGMFQTSAFNQPIGSWDVGNVTDMSATLFQAQSFNQPLNNWDVSNVLNMNNMFRTTRSFNQDLSSWDVSNVTNMDLMFAETDIFNQPLNSWNVSNVTSMNAMFRNAFQFNQDLSSWDVSNVTTMQVMFWNAVSFNQPLNSWNVGNVTNMLGMFQNAQSFSQDLSGWNTVNNTVFSRMFQDALQFDQDLGAWNIERLTTAEDMFTNAGLSTANYDATLTGWATLETGETQVPTNITFNGGNSQYCNSVTQRQNLIDSFNWIITDGGKLCEETQATLNPDGSLTVEDSIGEPNDDNFTLSLNGVNLVLSNTVPIAVSGDGVIQIDANTVEVPLVTITKGIEIDGAAGLNTLSIDSSLSLTGDGNNLTVRNTDVRVFNTGSSVLVLNALIINGDSEYDTNGLTTEVITEANFFDGSAIVGTGTLLGTLNMSDFSTIAPGTSPGILNTGNLTLGADAAFDVEVNGPVAGALDGHDQIKVTGTVELGGALLDINREIGFNYMGNPGDELIIIDNDGTDAVNGTFADLAEGAAINDDFIGTISYKGGDGNDVVLLSTSTIDFSGAFITTWKTENNAPFGSGPNSLELAINGTPFDIDWGDGTVETIINGAPIHTYDNPGTYVVKVKGELNSINFDLEKEKLIEINQWGSEKWKLMTSTFKGFVNLDVVANDAPDLSELEELDLESLFEGCESLVGNDNFNKWDVSSIELMGDMFNGASSFNADISDWQVSNVTNMDGMFDGALLFNVDISGWNVSNVKDMSLMFRNAFNFNQNLNSWLVSNVKNMTSMFNRASSFNGDISSWDTSNLLYTSRMFFGAKDFNRNIGNWDVSKVKSMSFMFTDALSFNQNIGNWDVSSVSQMQGMFWNAQAFDQDLSVWDISNIRQDFPTSGMINMFDQSKLSLQNYDNTLIGWVTLDIESGETKIPENIYFDGGNSQYCLSEDARESLISDFGWVINDSGLKCNEASLLITEIMYDPTSNSDGEWIEIYNSGSEAIDLDGYVLDDNTAAGISAANIPSFLLMPNKSVILYDDDLPEGQFEHDWGTADAIGVANWPPLNNDGDSIGIWDSFEAYSGDNEDQLNTIEQVVYDVGSGWPNGADGKSIFLIALEFDNTEGGSWSLSSSELGEEETPLFNSYESAQGDIGSPGNPNEIEDNEAPTITCPEPVTINTQENSCEASFPLLEPTATDNVSEIIEFEGVRSDNLNLTDPFQKGSTTITWTAIDEAGNRSEPCEQIITVIDEENPEITCSGDISIIGTGAQFVDIESPVVSDNCSDPLILTFERLDDNTLGLEDEFPIGNTIITWTVVDASNNIAVCTQTVTITSGQTAANDITAFSIPNQIGDTEIDLEANTVTLKVPFGTNLSALTPTIMVSEGSTVNPASGEENDFSTPVIYFITTSNDLEAEWTVIVEVEEDLEPPVIECPANIIVDNDLGVCGAIVEFTPTATDNSGEVTISADFMSETEFQEGDTVVTVTATDSSGNSSTCSFTVTVKDNEEPTLVCSENIEKVSVNNEPVIIDIPTPEHDDNCGLQPDLTAVRDDNIDFGQPYPVGTTTITWSITDIAGNIGTCTQTVTILPDVASLSITGFTLINADTDLPIFDLTEGQKIDINTLPTTHLDIRANTTDDVESVRISLNGALTTARTESLTPFALYRDLPIGDYIGADFIVGNYTVAAIPYAEDGLGGDMGNLFAINFELVDGDPACSSLTASYTTENPTTCGGGGNVTIIPSGGTPPYLVAWSSFSFEGETAIGLSAGIYSANVYDSNGCSIRIDVEILDPEQPEVTLNPFSDITENELPFLLSGGMPEGGAYSGEGVSAGIFEPSGPGIYEISYTYENPVTKCINTATQEITVVPESTNRVTSFTLINADTNLPLFDLTEDQQIDINSLPTMHLDIRANTAEGVESVRISLAGALTTARTESLQPFALYRDLPIGDYIGEDFIVGAYTVAAIPYSENGLGGEMGNSFAINFELVDGDPVCASLTAVYTSEDPTTCGGGGNVTIIPSGGTPPYVVAWSSFSFEGETATGLSAGNYSANVYDSNGCSIRIDVQILDPEPPEVTLNPFLDVLDTDTAFDLSGGLPEGGEYSVNGIANAMFNPSEGIGTYEITYKYTDPITECSNTATQEIVVKAESQNTIIAFWLVNADNEQDLFPITDGLQIDISSLPTQNLDIRAETGTDTESVGFELLGTQSITRSESVPPYALYQDLPIGDYIGHNFDLGEYTLSGTPYTENSLNGDSGETVTIDFEFIDSTPTLAVLGFTLMDAENESEHFDLVDGMEIRLSEIGSLFLDIRANTTNDVESVRLELSGEQSTVRTESLEPFALFRDLPIGDYIGNNFDYGEYTVTATPYAEDNLGGDMGIPLSITFTIVEELAENALKISPNQVSNLARASFERPIDIQQILIFDMSGRIIESYNPQYIKSGNDYVLDVNFYQQGAYIVKMVDNKGVPYQKQMVVKRQ